MSAGSAPNRPADDLVRTDDNKASTCAVSFTGVDAVLAVAKTDFLPYQCSGCRKVFW